MSKYKDEILCEVVDMDACDLLLGRRWQICRNAVHWERENCYAFTKDKMRIVLCTYNFVPPKKSSQVSQFQSIVDFQTKHEQECKEPHNLSRESSKKTIGSIVTLNQIDEKEDMQLVNNQGDVTLHQRSILLASKKVDFVISDLTKVMSNCVLLKQALQVQVNPKYVSMQQSSSLTRPQRLPKQNFLLMFFQMGVTFRIKLSIFMRIIFDRGKLEVEFRLRREE